MDRLPQTNDNSEIELKLNEQGFVTLPFDKEDFRAFVVGLLGKPQVIDGELREPFEIDVTNIRNIFDLVYQRVTQQNDGVLIQFNARIIFSDNSSVLLNSFEELITYNVIKPVITTALHLTFQFLIKFQDKKVPEKQEVNISFVTQERDSVRQLSKQIAYSPLLHIPASLLSQMKIGYIEYNIKHTARTWGTDIESILVNHFKTIIKSENPFRKFLRRYQGIINFLLFFIVMGLGVLLSHSIINQFLLDKTSQIEQVFSKSKLLTLDEISNQLKFVAENNPFDSSSVYLIGGFVSFLIAGICVLISSSMISEPKSSYLLLSKESFKNKENKERSYSKQFSNYVWSVIVSTAIGLLTNIIYEYLKN